MEYQFRPIGKKCAATGEDLVPGDECYSVLVGKDGGLERCKIGRVWHFSNPSAGEGSLLALKRSGERLQDSASQGKTQLCD